MNSTDTLTAVFGVLDYGLQKKCRGLKRCVMGFSTFDNLLEDMYRAKFADSWILSRKIDDVYVQFRTSGVDLISLRVYNPSHRSMSYGSNDHALSTIGQLPMGYIAGLVLFGDGMHNVFGVLRGGRVINDHYPCERCQEVKSLLPIVSASVGDPVS